LAGKAHIAESSRFELFQDFMEANHLLTFNIARASVLSSVKRIVLLSSASVYGLNSSSQFISESYPTIPTSSYGLSKLLAEYSLHDVLYKTDTDYVILRSPMVYGENSPGNFRRLSRLFNTFYILPFSAISAKRSFIFVGNLVDILLLSCTLAKLSNGIYNISDCYDISLRDICAAYLHSLPGIRPLLPIPKCILSFLAFLSGSYRDWQKMSSPLRFDVNSFIKASNWQPRFQPIDSMQKIF
jgi:nucleoside-diphosphate-sugar epimerase